ncbi:phosphotransferase [Actinoplanes sp. NBC_00393]|uniref:phosphotransferase enzyme family protein n=1 Tax=Actinoplanes sp. NBC_00393 TaxID=2975953 RepID=UPI002E1D47E3
MKTLPDNPDLDQLRRQAKDLLAGLRDIRPRTTLAEAQASLAEQYGFRTWTDLKAEVDRLQGGAEVADPALARQIAARFGLGEVTGEMRSVSRPDEVGRRWLVPTVRGRWSARTVDDVYPVTDGEENARFQESAARAGVLLPAPVRSIEGAVVEEIGGSRWRVYEWLRTGPPLAAPVSATVTRAVGATLATIHGMRFPADRLCYWSSNRLSPRSWPETADLAAAKGADWAPVLRAALPTLLGLEAIGGEPGDPVLCHNNLNPGNVRVGAAGRLVVTGWEHAAGLPPAWELCSALVNWTVTPGGGVNARGARALVEGYGTLPQLDLQAFRGTATALQNYVSGQVDLALDEPTGFAERNVRHLLTHLPSQATFEEILAVVQRT